MKVTVDDETQLAGRFEDNRAHLRSVAYRMLGSLSDAEDAVQETWLRLARSDTSTVQNLRGWLTTVVSRVCLDMLRARTARGEDPLDAHVPDPIVDPVPGSDPEQRALLADSVGLALLVVLDTLAPGERLAFVLHDIFAMPFDQIGPIVDRTPDAARQLASRARRRLRATPIADVDTAPRWDVVDAFLTAARGGDLEGLLAILDPEVLLRADAGDGPVGPSQVLRGSRMVASQALRFSQVARDARRVLVNGGPGLIAVRDGRGVALISLTIAAERIVEIDILADPARLHAMDLTNVGIGA
jgi:RNA polymerase sigma-70 factor (ECF subfamily)